MSKQIVKTNGNSHVPQRAAQDLQKYSQSTLPQVREANLPAVRHQESSIITTYKDLDQPARDFALNQKRQLIIGVFTFIILGVGIMMGQKFSAKNTINVNEKRVVASEGMVKMIPKDASINSSEHYEFDKSCYTESNGEQVCTTRTSRSKN